MKNTLSLRFIKQLRCKKCEYKGKVIPKRKAINGNTMLVYDCPICKSHIENIIKTDGKKGRGY